MTSFTLLPSLASADGNVAAGTAIPLSAASEIARPSRNRTAYLPGSSSVSGNSNALPSYTNIQPYRDMLSVDALHISTYSVSGNAVRPVGFAITSLMRTSPELTWNVRADSTAVPISIPDADKSNNRFNDFILLLYLIFNTCVTV